jgi:GcrA cell cycle regulator
MPYDWNPYSIDRLRMHVAEKLSARLIAIEMGGGLTRNAVIGKMRRLGLSSGYVKLAPKPKSKPRPRRARRSVVPAAPRATETGRLFASGDIGILQLNVFRCHYPVNDEDKETRYCGGLTREGSSYCAEHHVVCYQARR